MLLHVPHRVFNSIIDTLHRTVDIAANTHSIGQVQILWANVDKNHSQLLLYPKTKCTPGGITDRLMSDYPNMHGDMSAGSGLNFLTRDEDHARAFIERHQNKLMFGSDCDDRVGSGPACDGAQILAGIRRLAPNPAAARKILCENAKRLLRLSSV